MNELPQEWRVIAAFSLLLVTFGAFFALTRRGKQLLSFTSFSLTRKASAPAEPFLNRKRKEMTLIEKQIISHDTIKFIFSLEHPAQCLGLCCGQHIKLFAPNRKGIEDGLWNGQPDPEHLFEEISRKYTPISPTDLKGKIYLLIKIYKKNKIFIDGGKMSLFLKSLKLGEKVQVEGPFGLIKYLGRGCFTIGPRKIKNKNKIGLIAGGTGITPIYQFIQKVLEDPKDETKMFLLFANKTEEDILLRDELEELALHHPSRLSLHYTVDLPPPSWPFSSGFINKNLIFKFIPPPSKDVFILCCGPPLMVQLSCIKNLKEMGYKDEDVACF